MNFSKQFLAIMGLVAFLGALTATAEAKPGSWLKITSGNRFEELDSFLDQAILDRETGLVWWKQSGSIGSLSAAQEACMNFNGGSRFGWRLPTFAELTSIMSTSTLTPESPSFVVSMSSPNYWSSTVVKNSQGDDAIKNWQIGVGDYYNYAFHPGQTPQFANFLCVRGPGN